MALKPASGPFNMEQGNSAAFVVEFLDIKGLITSPASPSLTVSYTNTSYNPQVDTVALVQSGSFYNGTWSSTSANLGLAPWVITAPSSVQCAIGTLRVIQRKGSS